MADTDGQGTVTKDILLCPLPHSREGTMDLYCLHPFSSHPPTHPEQEPLALKGVKHIQIQHFFSFLIAFVLIFILQASRSALSPNLVGAMNKPTVHGLGDADSISLPLSTL